LHLSLPALDIGFDTTTLTRAKVVHDAFRNPLIAGDWSH
jgi:hypothetical protein